MGLLRGSETPLLVGDISNCDRPVADLQIRRLRGGALVCAGVQYREAAPMRSRYSARRHDRRFQCARPRLGDDIDDFCVKCKRVMNHSVVSILNDAPAKVRCRTCHSDHDFRHEQAAAAESGSAQSGAVQSGSGERHRRGAAD